MTYCKDYCSYTSFSSSVRYAFVGMPPAGCQCSPFEKTPNGHRSLDSLLNHLAVQIVQYVVDPDRTLRPAWTDMYQYGIGDKCNFNFGTVKELQPEVYYNAKVGSKKYLLQGLWDPKTQSCAWGSTEVEPECNKPKPKNLYDQVSALVKQVTTTCTGDCGLVKCCENKVGPTLLEMNGWKYKTEKNQFCAFQ